MCIAFVVVLGTWPVMSPEIAVVREEDPVPFGWFVGDEYDDAADSNSPRGGSDGTSSGDGSITVSRAAGSVNPAGCSTKAHDPHPSTHQRGRINAEFHQQCPMAVRKNSAEAKLWEKRWWGFNVIAGPVFSDLRTRRSVSVFVNAPCRHNHIRVTGFGHYEWGGVHIRSAEVSTTKWVAC